MRRWIVPGAAVTVGAVIWMRLPEHQKRYFASIVRQLPELPGRYAV
jgi:hypothetical protein